MRDISQTEVGEPAAQDDDPSTITWKLQFEAASAPGADDDELRAELTRVLGRELKVNTGGQYCSTLEELQRVLQQEGLDCQVKNPGAKNESLVADQSRQWSIAQAQGAGWTPGVEGEWNWENAEAFIATVPAGHWTSIGDLAAAAGKPKGSQAAGSALRRAYEKRAAAGELQPDSIHRVLKAGGKTDSSWLPDDQIERAKIGKLEANEASGGSEEDEVLRWHGDVELPYQAGIHFPAELQPQQARELVQRFTDTFRNKDLELGDAELLRWVRITE